VFLDAAQNDITKFMSLNIQVCNFSVPIVQLINSLQAKISKYNSNTTTLNTMHKRKLHQPFGSVRRHTCSYQFCSFKAASIYAGHAFIVCSLLDRETKKIFKFIIKLWTTISLFLTARGRCNCWSVSYVGVSNFLEGTSCLYLHTIRSRSGGGLLGGNFLPPHVNFLAWGEQSPSVPPRPRMVAFLP